MIKTPNRLSNVKVQIIPFNTSKLSKPDLHPPPEPLNFIGCDTHIVNMFGEYFINMINEIMLIT